MNPIWIVLYVFLAACGLHDTAPIQHPAALTPLISEPEHRFVNIDEDFDTEARLTVLLAVDIWNTAVHGRIVFDSRITNFMQSPLVNSGVSIFQVGEDCTFIPELSSGYRVLAWVDEIPGHYMWVVRDRMQGDPAKLRSVLLHEFGHILGAKHTMYGLMTALDDGTRYSCIDYSAANQVADSLEIPLLAMNWCEER